MVKAVFFNLKNWSIHQYWEKTISKHMELNGDDVYNVSLTRLCCGDDLKSGRRYENLHAQIAAKTSEHTNQMFKPAKQIEIEGFWTQNDLLHAEQILGLADLEELKTLVYKGIPIGKLVRTSCVRQAHTVDESSEEYRDFFYDNISTAIYLVDAFERILSQINPDVVFCMNGIFFAERILVEMCKIRGTRIVTYERAARPQHLYITANEPINLFNFDNQYEKVKDFDLSVQETEEILKYLKDRRTSRNTTQQFQTGNKDDKEEVKKYLDFDKLKNKKVITLFTNVMWDTAAVDKDTIFNSVLDWCLKTIDWAKTQKNTQVFIRIHPADARYWNFPGAKQLQEEIIKLYEIPKNVRIIKSQEHVNSYVLAELSDLCVTYTSQIGIELAAQGRPLIIAGEAFYRNKGFGFTPKTQGQYFDYLAQKDDWIIGQDEALKYAHFLYFKQHYPISIVVEDASRGMGVVTNLKFLINGVVDYSVIKNDKELQRIADYIREGIKDEYNVPIYKVKP